MIRAEGDEAEPLWPIVVEVVGLPGAERHPRKVSVEVNGHTHVGNLCDMISRKADLQIDWSNYALWWPKNNVWLLNGSFTLDNWEISARDVLEYAPKVHPVQVMLPDMQVYLFEVDFSKRVFEVVKDICRKLFIRRPEELSLYRNRVTTSEKDRKASEDNSGIHFNSTLMSFHQNPPQFGPSTTTIDDVVRQKGLVPLEKTPQSLPPSSHLALLPCTRKVTDKVKFSSGWLTSATSLMQQEIRSGDLLMLRYKYSTNMDLDMRKDSVRINQLYEQTRLSILNDDSELTVEEAVVLAGIMYQVDTQASIPQVSEMSSNGNGNHRGSMDGRLDDEGVNELDIESELNDLQLELEGGNNQGSAAAKPALTREPMLQNIVKVSRKKDSKLATLGKNKFFVCTLQRFKLIIFDKSVEETGPSQDKIVNQLNVKGCEVSQIGEGSKFKLKLNVDTGSGMEEFHLSVEDVNTYAKWYVALQLAGRGHTMADSSFEEQLRNTREMLQYRCSGNESSSASGFTSPSSPKRNGAASTSSAHGTPKQVDGELLDKVQPEFYLSPRFIKKFKKDAAAQIVKGSGQVAGMGYVEAKKQLIARWNDVKLSDTQFFNCSIRRGMKPVEKGIIGVCRDKLIQMDTKGQDIVQTYRYSTMQTWTINWHKNELQIKLGDMELSVASIDSKISVLHEYLGGYQFMATRSPDKQEVNVEMFYQLTYGMKSEEEKIEELQKRDNKYAGLITHSVPGF